jgi:hypothetical protein
MCLSDVSALSPSRIFTLFTIVLFYGVTKLKGYLASLNGSIAPLHGFFHGGHNNSAFYASDLFQKWAY